ncbi:substrate-binding domain-containing protein [Paenibacillus abyssi]|uniref:Rhizopine-binding protein n=1 Tax=Paenibacillus abyssi TaxID=1340531 RepID=A0A917G4N8_9BACL|nr:substrate-binding domain-containing protein [Paenibacillus abyssi]GGG22949.1 rhizopine-binding protein [Paenibacillus abyssi]
MKKMNILVFVTLLTFVLAACGSGGNEPAATTAGAGEEATKAMKVGVTYSNLQNEYIIATQNAIRDKAAELGVELIENDGQGKAENQITQVENYITQKVDAIIVSPTDRNGVAPAIDLAVNANIPVIILTAEVANLDKATAFVGSDDVIAGKMETEFVLEKLGGTGNVVIMHGPNGNSAQINRSEGIKQVLSLNPDVQVLAEQTANWDRAQALSLMENWLQTYPDIDAVIAQNDEMALGAYNAIEAAGKQDEIMVVGIDAIPDALKSVGEDKLAATVFQDARGQGSTALEIAVKSANGETVEHMNFIPFQLVTKENLADFQ